MLVSRVYLPLFLACLANATMLELQTGTLDLSKGHPVTGGSVIVSFDSSFPSSSKSSLETTLASLSPPGTLLGLLPPNAFLVHVPKSAAGAFVESVGRNSPPFLEVSGVPPTHKSLLLSTPHPAPYPANHTLRVKLVANPGGMGALRELLSHACPTCPLVTPHETLALVSPCPSCSSSLPTSLIHSIALLEDVVWIETQSLQMHKKNAFGGGIMGSTDLLNWGEVNSEFGSCGTLTSDSCGSLDNIAFSNTAQLYPPPSTVSSSAHGSHPYVATTPEEVTRRRRRRLHESTTHHAPPRKPSQKVRPGQSAPSTSATDPSTPKYTSAAGSRKSPPKRAHHTAGPHTPRHPRVNPRVNRTAAAMVSSSSSSSSSLGVCTDAKCGAPSCGLGFSFCGGISPFSSALAVTGLTGAGQVVNVVDSGLDYTSPFFSDGSATVTPSKTAPTTLSGHRKVGAYWSFMDGLDEAGGHGTHVSGSVAGDPRPTITSIKAAAPLDAAAFTVGSSLAPNARIYFTDLTCDTPGGCVSPASEPSPGCPPVTGCAQSQALWFPSNFTGLFNPPFKAGVRISTNSYGADGDFSQYTDATKDLDQYVIDHPDFLHLFAASNDGTGNRFSSLSSLAVAKNVVAVGATKDGLLAHQAKIRDTVDPELGTIPALFQGFDGRGCNAVLQDAYLYKSIECPAGVPTVAQCAELSRVYPDVYGNGYTEDSNNYRPEDNIDVALCCGCTPRKVMDGLKARGGDWFSNITSFVATYNSRWRVEFSSPGPALDGRIKPDVAAPGEDVISARASGSGRTYGAFTCPDSPVSYTLTDPSQTPLSQTGDDFDAPIFEIFIFADEAVALTDISIPLLSLSENAFFWVVLVDDNRRYVSGAAYVLATASTIPFTLSFATTFDGTSLYHEIPPGSQWSILVYADFGAEMDFTGTLEAIEYETDCYGFFASNLRATVTLERGTADSFLLASSGTSMATPATASLVALIRQYYVGGYYPGGTSSTPTAGFSPSAALMKATLINSATALVVEDFFAQLLPGFTPPTAAQVYAEGGFGVPNLVRGLSFNSLAGTIRASGALPTLLLPGHTATTTTTGHGGDPSIQDGGLMSWCVDVKQGDVGVAGAVPLSATLVYTDPAALPNALYALVNSLNLEVITPSGAVYLGNNEQGVSPQQLDNRNNVEKLTLYSPTRTLSFSGARLTQPYTVVVRGTFVPFGPQFFSLVLTGPGITISSATCTTPAPNGGGGGVGMPSATPTPSPPSPASAAAADDGLDGAAVAVEIVLILLFFACGMGCTCLYFKEMCCFKGCRGGAGVKGGVGGGGRGGGGMVGGGALELSNVNPINNSIGMGGGGGGGGGGGSGGGGTPQAWR